ncbi:MAG: serine hydrolase, partial [Ferruginibacter sp.]
LRFNTFWNNDLNISELQAIEKCKNSMHCRWRPGEREAYCNIDYNILGYLIEKLSGLKYDVFLKKEILLPIGMTNTNFITPTQPNPAYANPYEWDDKKYNRLPFLQPYGKGAGALYSCADDMAKFVQYMLNNGNNEIEQMEIPESTPAAKLGLKTGYAKGITIDYLNYKFPFYGHGGTSIGFFSRYAYNRDLKAGFIVCGSNPNQISDILIHYFTDSLQTPQPIPTIPVNIETLKSYEGYYQLKSPRFEIIDKYLEELLHGYHIEVRRDSLYSYGFKRPDQVLLPVKANIFKKQNENSPSFLFTKNSEGNKVLYEWGAYFEKTSYTKIVVTQILVLGGLVSGILLLLSSIFWLFQAIFKKLSWKEYFKRSLSAFGVLSLIIAFGTLAYMATNVSLMGTVNFFTITFFIGTILFAVLCIAGFILTIKRFRQITNKWTKWYLFVTTTWLLALVVFYFHYDWIGLRMWSY